MTKEPYPSDKQDKFMLRLPDGLRDRVKAVAEQKSRSMNAEIVATLEAFYPEPDQQLKAMVDFVRSALPGQTEELYGFLANCMIKDVNALLSKLVTMPDENSGEEPEDSKIPRRA